MFQKGFDLVLVAPHLNAPDLSLVLFAAVGAMVVSVVLVFRKWDSYGIPMRLLPLDIATFVLLFDLNIKSLNGVTVDNFVMKLEAIGFTALLTFVLFVPVIWKLSQGRKKSGAS